MFGGPGTVRSATTLWLSVWLPSTALPSVDCRPRLNPDCLQHAASEQRNLLSFEPVLVPFFTKQVFASGNTTYLECTRRTSLGFAQGTDRAVEPIARPEWHAGRFPWHAAFTVVQFSLLILPDQRPYTVKNMCIYSVYIQGDSLLVDITAGGDFLGLCDQKSSYKHVSDFGRLRSYDRLKLGIEGNDYWQ